MTFHDRGTSWFLAQLKPNCANIADKNLKRQGFQTFLPMEEETRQRNGKFVTAMRPLFPGYIFVAFDVARGFWRTVNSTYGITRLVSFGKEPTAVPLDLISQLMLRCDAKGKLLPPKLLKPGDQVTLTKGPFANFVAEVEKIAPDRRVWVLMEIMGGQTRVAVGADQLRAV
ncbi:transcription termination/antitermination protein NusG [Pseudothioclava nitratireducens]|jgi:transcriptional antiterminator RfaH|uniref:transcription termination/antitermination protein NusG n=1 Tax=Pseudothioclava nitratireducens TaxID=1928646 RepID=UPI0023DA3DDD|nr:transcriptional activator RfaH [Defluviimonas nitratireducens]MDF1621720.1 transcriptional activator RfaH [Defluviimonas nitratireducens]